MKTTRQGYRICRARVQIAPETESLIPSPLEWSANKARKVLFGSRRSADGFFREQISLSDDQQTHPMELERADLSSGHIVHMHAIGQQNTAVTHS
jgi:hypothetical protein